MKKAYSKPELFCEEYQLTQSIAATCGHTVHAFNKTMNDVNSCGYNVAGDLIFITDSICDIIASDFGSEENFIGMYGFCYFAAGDNSVVFSS